MKVFLRYRAAIDSSVQKSLPTPYSLLPTPHSLLPTPYSPLPTPHSDNGGTSCNA
ncbi:MAG: hypothetical protein KME42_08100 [Tildeniella nuda ZEHNDER 1965/U140]|nr:hypothetical protein [Tildeniella nuda ZEHNDER 1965/U140]